MSHRTYGETRDCKGCRYWSEMVAQSIGNSIGALCLAHGGEYSGKYTFSGMVCTKYASGEYGAIDEPGQDMDAYAQERAK